MNTLVALLTLASLASAEYTAPSLDRVNEIITAVSTEMRTNLDYVPPTLRLGKIFVYYIVYIILLKVILLNMVFISFS